MITKGLRSTLGCTTFNFVQQKSQLAIKWLYLAKKGLLLGATDAPTRTLFQLFGTNLAFSCYIKQNI